MRSTRGVTTATREQILIIDDDREMKSLVQNFLQNRNHEIYQTDDAEKGFSLAQNINPLFVLLSADIKNGLLTCRKFKKDKFLKMVPLILVSGKDATRVFMEHRKLPTRADGYLIKPFSEEEFLAVLGDVVPERLSGISTEMSVAEVDDRTIVSRDLLDSPLINYIEEEMREMRSMISDLKAEKELLLKRLNSFEASHKDEIKSGLPTEFKEVSQKKAISDTMEMAEQSAKKSVSAMKAAQLEQRKRESVEKQVEKIEAAEKESARLKEELDALRKKNSKLREELDSRSSIFMRLEFGYKETINSLIAEKEDLQAELAVLQKNEAEMKKELEYLRGEHKSAITDRERLKQIPLLIEEIEKLKKLEHENEALKKLIEEKSGMEEQYLKKAAELEKIARERDSMKERVASLEKEKETYLKLLGDLRGVFERFKA